MAIELDFDTARAAASALWFRGNSYLHRGIDYETLLWASESFRDAANTYMILANHQTPPSEECVRYWRMRADECRELAAEALERLALAPA